LSELQKDVEKQLLNLPENEREAARTKFAVFVVHNKVDQLHIPKALVINALAS